MTRTAWTAAALGGALLLAGFAGPAASAASYEFLAAPANNLNRVYRLDKATGEMGACQYGLVQGGDDKKDDVGVTLCYPPGLGGGAQAQSEYALVASHHDKESGVFRVDVRAGTMSICYVLNGAVVCTPQAK